MKISKIFAFLAATTAPKAAAADDYIFLTESQRVFEKKLGRAMEAVRALLDTTRNPVLISDDAAANHTWTDKYSVAEFVTNTAIAAYWNALERMLELKEEDYQIMQQWVSQDDKNVILRFQAQDSFIFQKEVIANVDLGKTEDESMWESISRNKVVTKRTEYHWNAQISYKIQACRGSCDNGDDSLTLLDRERTMNVITLNQNAPIPEQTILPPCRHEPHMAAKHDETRSASESLCH